MTEASVRPVMFVYLPGCQQHIPYARPEKYPLLSSRIRTMQENGHQPLPCPMRIINFKIDDGSDMDQSISADYNVSLYSLPKPNKSVHHTMTIAEMESSIASSCSTHSFPLKQEEHTLPSEFPDDLEVSFHCGTLNTSTTLMDENFKQVDNSVMVPDLEQSAAKHENSTSISQIEFYYGENSKDVTAPGTSNPLPPIFYPRAQKRAVHPTVKRRKL